MTFEELQIGFWVQDPCKDFPVQVHAMDASDKYRVWVYGDNGGIYLYRTSVDHLKPIEFNTNQIDPNDWPVLPENMWIVDCDSANQGCFIHIGEAPYPGADMVEACKIRYVHDLQAFCRGIGCAEPRFLFLDHESSESIDRETSDKPNQNKRRFFLASASLSYRGEYAFRIFSVIMPGRFPSKKELEQIARSQFDLQPEDSVEILSISELSKEDFDQFNKEA